MMERWSDKRGMVEHFHLALTERELVELPRERLDTLHRGLWMVENALCPPEEDDA